MGRKLAGKSRDEIMRAISSKFPAAVVIQQSLDVIWVTFKTVDDARDVVSLGGIRLFGLWCKVDGGPPSSILHLFDYPFEASDDHVKDTFSSYGLVRKVRGQKYLGSEIFTGTRLIDLVTSRPPPCFVIVDGFTCRVWFKGQPLICNICQTEGHKAVDCPDRDRCRLCSEMGHIARECPTCAYANAVGQQEPRVEAVPDPFVADAAASAESVVVTEEGGSGDPVPLPMDLSPAGDALPLTELLLRLWLRLLPTLRPMVGVSLPNKLVNPS